MAEKIKGITVEIGGDTANLQTALTQVNKHSKSLQTELYKVNKLLKLDPSNTELVGQKQQILAGLIADTKTKLDALNKAQEQVKEKLGAGEISEEAYRQYQRDVIKTEQELQKLQSQMDETKTATEQLGDKVKESGSDISKGSENIKEFGTNLDSLKSIAKTAGAAVTAAIAGMVTSAVAVTESTAEFRSDFSKLQQNAEIAGSSIEGVSDQLKRLEAITGESDSSIEGLSNFLKAGFTDDNLATIVEELSGAIIQFPDTLKIESLADSLQETLATGAATGQFSELLERLGLDLDVFNAGLEKCTSDVDKQNYAMQVLADTGLANVTKEYEENNKVLIESANAQYDMRAAMSDIANQVAPSVAEATEMVADKVSILSENVLPGMIDGLDWILDNAETIASGMAGIGAAMLTSKAVTAVTSVVDTVKKLKTATDAAAASQTALNVAQSANPVGLLVTLFAGLTAGIVTYTALTSDATDKTKDMIETSQNLRSEISQCREEYENETEEIEKQYGAADMLASSLYELSDKENKTNEEKQQMVGLVNQLNEAIPDLNLQIDEETGLLSMQRTELQGLIDKTKEYYLVKANENAVQSAAEDVVSANDNVDALKKQREEVQGELDALQSKLDEMYENRLTLKTIVLGYDEDPNQLNYEIEKLQAKIYSLSDEISKAQSTATDAMEYYEEKVNQLGTTTSGFTADTARGIQEQAELTEEQMEELTDEFTDKYESAMNKNTEALKDNLEKNVDSIEKSYDARITALKKSQKEEQHQFEKTQQAETKALEEEYEKQYDAAEELQKKKLELIDEEYLEKQKLVDEEKYQKLKELQSQIDQLNAQTEAENRAVEEKEEAEKIAELKSKALSAETAEERLEAAEELKDYEEELARKRRQTERSLQVDILEEQKDTIEEEYDMKTDAISDEKEKAIDAVNEEYNAKKEALDKELEYAKEVLEEKQYLESEALSEKQESLLEALETEKTNAVENQKKINEEILSQYEELQSKKLEKLKEYLAQEKEEAAKAIQNNSFSPNQVTVWNNGAFTADTQNIDYDKMTDSFLSALNRADNKGYTITYNKKRIAEINQASIERSLR